MAELIGVTSVNTGWGKSLGYGLARVFGAKPCALKALSHGLFRSSSAWHRLASTLSEELGHRLTVVAPNEAEPAISEASRGREPCVLIRDPEGGVSMIADWNDLAASAGRIDVFERILRSKLLMY
jgi:hypothetical protein